VDDQITTPQGCILTRPNLFRFATGELSQDAFLCWLLDWASAEHAEDDASLHRAGRTLLKALLEKHGEAAVDVSHVTVHPQYFGADVVAEIGDRLVLLIEDKIHAEQHDNQLTRYKAAVTEKFPFRAAASCLLF
jgi:hypothetical protein